MGLFRHSDMIDIVAGVALGALVILAILQSLDGLV